MSLSSGLKAEAEEDVRFSCVCEFKDTKLILKPKKKRKNVVKKYCFNIQHIVIVAGLIYIFCLFICAHVSVHVCVCGLSPQKENKLRVFVHIICVITCHN